MLDRVFRALVPDDPSGPFRLPVGPQTAGGLFQNVQELAAHELGAHAFEDRASTPERVLGNSGGVEQLVAPSQAEVTEEQRRRTAELRRVALPSACLMVFGEPAVYRRLASADVGAVHQVVVDQRSSMEELEARRRGDNGGIVWWARAPPPPVTEGRPQSLAACDQIAGGVHQGKQVGALCAQ